MQPDAQNTSQTNLLSIQSRLEPIQDVACRTEAIPAAWDVTCIRKAKLFLDIFENDLFLHAKGVLTSF